MGESGALDFSFEELEFIDGDLKDLKDDKGDAIADPNQMTAEEVKAAEDKAAAEADVAAAAAAEGKTAEEIKAEKIAAAKAAADGDAAEGTSPDAVSGSSTEDGNKGDGEATSPQLYQTLTDVLREKGVLSSVEESSLKDIKDVDGIVEAIKAQIKAEELSDLDTTQKTVLKDMREGVETETANQFKSAMDNLNKLDDAKISEDKQVRFDLIYQDFLAKGFGKDKAIKLSNRSFEMKEDEVDAKEAKQSLIKAVTDRYNTSAQKEKDSAKAKVDALKAEKDALKNKILEGKEVIKGFDVPEVLRKEVYEGMVKTVSTNPDTGAPENELMKFQRENPVEYSQKLYYLFKVTNGFNDMDYFKGKKTTSSVKALETALRQSTHVSGGGNPSFADDGNSQSLDIGELVLPE